MEAKIKAEINCGECGGMMQYHENGKYVRCNTLKCSQRHINYLAPTITLKLEKEKEEVKDEQKPARKKPATKA